MNACVSNFTTNDQNRVNCLQATHSSSTGNNCISMNILLCAPLCNHTQVLETI
eukprot:m.916532 g.916532  ORF g.916532 m.916532 type:complete len:53 (+) comp23735_c0_seq14:1367-1525(+)